MSAESTPAAAETAPSAPALRIVRGEPTAEEVAVLTAIVTAASGDPGEAPASPARGRWSDPAWMHRQPVRHGVGGWRASSR